MLFIDESQLHIDRVNKIEACKASICEVIEHDESIIVFASLVDLAMELYIRKCEDGSKELCLEAISAIYDVIEKKISEENLNDTTKQ